MWPMQRHGRDDPDPRMGWATDASAYLAARLICSKLEVSLMQSLQARGPDGRARAASKLYRAGTGAAALGQWARSLRVPCFGGRLLSENSWRGASLGEVVRREIGTLYQRKYRDHRSKGNAHSGSHSSDCSSSS